MWAQTQPYITYDNTVHGKGKNCSMLTQIHSSNVICWYNNSLLLKVKKKIRLVSGIYFVPTPPATVTV